MNPITHDVLWSECAYIDYLSEVDRLLYEQYGITADDLDAVAAAQESGDTPQEHADWIAERHRSAPCPRQVAGRRTHERQREGIANDASFF